MPRSLALALLLALAPGAPGWAQAIDEALVPGGVVRFSTSPVFTSWESRFGDTGREALGSDLTAPDALSLFPGAESLRSSIASLAADAAYAPVLGETTGRVTRDVTRIEFGLSLGVFDWLTVGAMLPWTRTRTTVDVLFRGDTMAADLGRNPRETDPAGVSAYLTALASAESAARASADQTCATLPGSPECTAALALADRAGAFFASASSAYDATPFFPHASSATAASLAAASAALEADLVAAGLPGIGTPMVFATQWVVDGDFADLPTSPFSGVAGDTLGDFRGLWGAGDVEVSLTARLLEGAVRRAEPVSPALPFAAPTLSYRVVLTLLARLPTGSIDDPNRLLDVGRGDGQTDFEARLLGELSLGSRLGLRAAGRYGVQQPRTLLRRVAPPELVLAPADALRLVEWTPGSYWGLEVAPALHLSDDLSLGAEYRYLTKERDDYELVDPAGPGPYDVSVLETESGITLHEMGVTLRYDTVARWVAGGPGWPLQLHARWLRAVSGDGGQTPVTTRLELGVRLFRSLWRG